MLTGAEVTNPMAGKLAELRARTDRDLAGLLYRTVEHGFDRLREADYCRAEHAYAEALPLLSLVKEFPPRELAEIRARMNELRAQLDEMAAPLAS